jgi:Rrf2 family iron-sulfur cluster assembly transcriptional regulator
MHAVIDLATYQGDGLIRVKDVARRLGISPGYLMRIVGPLIAAGIIRSATGFNGGIRLARPAQDIRFLDVFTVLEGSVAMVDCVGDATICSRSTACATAELWTKLTEAVFEFLNSRTIADSMEAHKNAPRSLSPCC